MSEIEFSDRVKKADQWSWVVSTLVTIVFFGVSLWLTLNVQFSAVVGAFTGIGLQFLIPYYASITTPADERQSLADHSTADDFHHGAAGSILIIGSVTAFLVMYFSENQNIALLVGGVLAAVLYIPIARTLPRR